MSDRITPVDSERAYPSLRAHLIGMLAIFAALFLGLTVYLYVTCRSIFSEALQRELSGDVEWLATTLESSPGMLTNQAWTDSVCKSVAQHKGFRVTIIDSSGKVAADSHVPIAELGTLENHYNRPEVRMAREIGWGHSWRYSNTLSLEMLYVARKIPKHPYYLRMAAGPVTLKSFQKVTLQVFAMFLGLFLIASMVITWWISRKISAPLLHLTAEKTDSNGYGGAGSPGSRPLAKAAPSALNEAPPHWDARFREATVLNEAFQGYVREIRKLADDVEKERDRLVAVLNQLEEGILILSKDGVIHAANPSSLRLLGVDPARIGVASWLGRPFAEKAPQQALARWVASASDPERPSIMHVDKAADAPFDLLCHLAPLDSGIPAGTAGAGEYLLTLINVTEFRHLDRVKSEFVANASHELKTPLSSIKGFAETLLEGALADAKVREPFVRKIHNNALRLERLVQDLLSLSHLEANTVPRETEPLPLRGYVNAAVNLHRHGLDAAGIRLENHVPDNLRLIMEPRDLELILNNLIGNAVKYNRAAGKIKIGIEEGAKPRLFVKDTGIGIPDEMLPRIFERFYRAGASRAQKEGTGLGLAIVKHAAHKYGMAVGAESTLGEGSRFTLDIPPEIIHRPG